MIPKDEDIVWIGKERELYESYFAMQKLAAWRAIRGKGKRHVNFPTLFEDQRICKSIRDFGIGSALHQILKKAEEIPNIRKTEDKMWEALDVANYAFALALELRRQVQLQQWQHQKRAKALVDDVLKRYEKLETEEPK